MVAVVKLYIYMQNLEVLVIIVKSTGVHVLKRYYTSDSLLITYITRLELLD